MSPRRAPTPVAPLGLLSQPLNLSRLGRLQARQSAPDPAPVVDYLPGLRRGVAGLLVGPPRVGKSLLSLAAAADVAAHGGRALALYGEDDAYLIAERVEALFPGQDAPPGLQLHSLVGESMHLLDARLQPTDLLAELESAGNGCDLIIIDPLSRCTPADENDNSAATALLQALNRLAKTTGAAVLLLHHPGKRGVDSRGASAIKAGVRWDATLQAIEPDLLRLEIGSVTSCAKPAAQLFRRGASGIPVWLRAEVDTAPMATASRTATRPQPTKEYDDGKDW